MVGGLYATVCRFVLCLWWWLFVVLVCLDMVDCLRLMCGLGFYVIVWIVVLLFVVMVNSVDLI